MKQQELYIPHEITTKSVNSLMSLSHERDCIYERINYMHDAIAHHLTPPENITRAKVTIQNLERQLVGLRDNR